MLDEAIAFAAGKPRGPINHRRAHHTLVQVGLDDIRIHVLHIQHMQFCFHTIQHALAVEHALFEVCRLLEKLELGGHLSKFPLFEEMKIISNSLQNDNLSQQTVLVQHMLLKSCKNKAPIKAFRKGTQRGYPGSHTT